MRNKKMKEMQEQIDTLILQINSIIKSIDDESEYKKFTPLLLLDGEYTVGEYEKNGDTFYYLHKNVSLWPKFIYYDRTRDDNKKSTSTMTLPDFTSQAELYRYVLENYKKINKGGVEK